MPDEINNCLILYPTDSDKSILHPRQDWHEWGRISSEPLIENLKSGGGNTCFFDLTHGSPGKCGSNFNSLWPKDAIWHQRSGSTLVQVMACCLTAPSHLPESMLTDHQWSQLTFILEQFHKRCHNHQSLKSLGKCHSNFPEANELRV